MHEKDNYLKTAELSTEQNCNMIDGAQLRWLEPPGQRRDDGAAAAGRYRDPPGAAPGKSRGTAPGWRPHAATLST